jgi:hypothetical protein
MLIDPSVNIFASINRSVPSLYAWYIVGVKPKSSILQPIFWEAREYFYSNNVLVRFCVDYMVNDS